MQVTNDKGFTLIELIAVIVLLSILGVVALSRLGNTDGFETRAFYDDVVNALRYAQKLAVSTGCEVQVSLSSTGYDLHQHQTDCISGAFTRDVLNPAKRTDAYQNSLAGAGISPAPRIMVFTAQSTVTGLGGDQAFTMGGRQFTVYQNSGLVDAQ